MGCGSKIVDPLGFGYGDAMFGGTDVKAPPKRSYAREYMDTLNVQIDSMPKLFKAQREWAPQMAQLGVDTAQGVMPGIMQMGNQYADSPIQRQLMQQAQGDLAQGGRLTPDQMRNIQQDTRAAFNDRGLGISNPAMFAEVMNLEGARQNRLRERQGFAQNVDQANFGRRQAGVSNAMQMMGYGTAQLFNPESGYAQDLYNTNYNGQAAANIATANNRAAMLGGIMNLGGSAIGAGAMAMCWVAREVYGETNPKWLLFREWLFTGAPRWFRALYAGWGDAFAAWIRNKPRLKRTIRHWMDARIKGMEV